MMKEEQREVQDKPHQFNQYQRDFVTEEQRKRAERKNLFRPKRPQKKVLTQNQKLKKENEKEAKKIVKLQKNILQKILQQVDAPQKGGQTTGWAIKGEVLQICNILKYMLGQFGLQGKVQYENQQYKTIQKWQVKEIIKQVDNTNLGDFMLKLPNPDNLPDDWKDKYKVYEEEGAQKSKYKSISISQALQFYYDLFDLQTSSKLESQKQNVAFLIAFYFLKYKSSFQANPDPIADSFLKVYEYYKMVENLDIKQYIQLRQQENFYDKHQYIIQQLFQSSYVQLECLQDGESVKEYHEAIWKNLKNLIYANLNQQITKKFGTGNKQEQQQCAIIFGKIKSISEMLKTFPDLIQHILDKIKAFQGKSSSKPSDQEEKKLSQQAQEERAKNQSSKVISKEDIQKKGKSKDYGFRDLFWGGYLKKTIIQQDVIWVNTKGRPNDVATLLRFCLLYKLVQKSKLYVRMFLNKDETHIMLVVKASQEILQNYAQKNKSILEVELGASDLFSFQPVDEYMRPLRKHKYVTDKEFMRKYNIKQGVIQQNKDQLNSIESQAINIYQKAQLMNEDQLRSLIIKDQFATNEMYDWVCARLEIDYINQKVLNNDYNKDTTDRQTWQLYYVYNKLITSFMKRVKALYGVSKKNKSYYSELEGNVGMLLRLMFLKAQCMCNDMYYEHREERSVFPRMISNLWTEKQKLKNLWNYLQIQRPSGFYTYYKIEKLERLWRKFQINQLKQRSKFFPSQRLIVTNCVMQQIVNMSVSLQKRHIIDYYPLHDPFILKSIQIQPYLSVIKNIDKKQARVPEQLDASTINKLYSQYECELTVSDFTKTSIEKQLQFKIFSFKSFETDCIRSYCGQKIAFYFVLIKFLALKAWPLMLPAFIIQCLLWAQNSDILARGTSSLTSLNNVLISIWTFINLFWTTHLIQSWKQQQKKLAQQYGSTNISVNQIKRVKFKGSFKRDFETDELNFEYVPKWKSVLKGVFTVIINLAYVGMVTEVILLLFVFKTYLYQSGYSQTIVQQGPAILISIAVQVFTKIYTILIKSIINFQNHKTVAEYQGSLISKVALITFVINFYSIFIFAYFSGYLASSYICEIKTTVTNVKIQNCDYYVSSQLISLVMVDFAVTLVGGITPYLVFKLKEWLRNRSINKTSKFHHNYFESIDSFFQEQDKLDSYMYNEELDNSWLGFMNIVNVFGATALFAPALPFTYVMMFLTGIVRLHASKYDVIYLKKRILPVKSNSIDWWLTILQIISYISIITNVAYMIYTRNVYPQYQARIFFLFIIIFFAIKYFLLAQYNTGLDIMAKRNEIKTNDVLMGRRQQLFANIPEEVNTDIENVIYDEKKLQRKFHNVKGPKVKDNMEDDSAEEEQGQKTKVE